MRTAIVTTTRDRPLVIPLLERWVKHQTMQPDLWLVINDSTEPEKYTYTMGQQVIHRTVDLVPGLPSICLNWLEALKHLDGYDRIFVFEDDDYYHPEYLATLNQLLDDHDLVGVSHAMYYQLPKMKFIKMGNDAHCSLASTAFRFNILPQIERMCKVFKSIYIDTYLWAECGRIWEARSKIITQPLENGRMLHVGFKNMPGKSGLGLGHHPNQGMYDPQFKTLTKWLGVDDSMVYKQFYRQYTR